MRRPRPPLPDPPPLGGIVLDGSNVIATGSQRALERLDLAIGWAQRWRPDLPVMVFVDAATARRLRPAAQDLLRGRCADVTPENARHAVCPRHEEADPFVLDYAREHSALVISNDRFFDYEELRLGTITLQFRISDGIFEPYEEATWFRPSGGAQRVMLTDLCEPID